jgi:CBS domain-containing protein
MMEVKRVEDLMLSLREYATIGVGATIEQALAALSKAQMGLTYDRHHHRAVLVLDPRGRVVGKVTHWTILASLDPGFLGEADDEVLRRANLSQAFIEALKARHELLPTSLERMCARAAKIGVEDAMVQVRDSVDRDAPLSEAIRKLIVGHCQSLLVTDGEEVVGILRLADVFEEVADLIRTGAEE